MTRFELQVTYRNKNGEPTIYEKLQGNDLLKLMVQFMLILVRVQQTYNQDEIDELKARMVDDDVPF